MGHERVNDGNKEEGRADGGNSDHRVAYLFEVFVAVDEFALVGILQPVSLDVLPERRHDGRSGLSVQSQQTRQPRIELELHRLSEKRMDG